MASICLGRNVLKNEWMNMVECLDGYYFESEWMDMVECLDGYGWVPGWIWLSAWMEIILKWTDGYVVSRWNHKTYFGMWNVMLIASLWFYPMEQCFTPLPYNWLINASEKVCLMLVYFRGRVMYRCISKLIHHCFTSWLVAFLVPSHYLTQWCLLLIKILGTYVVKFWLEIHPFSYKKID